MLSKNRQGLGKKAILLHLETASALGQEFFPYLRESSSRPVGECSQIEDDFKLHQDLNQT